MDRQETTPISGGIDLTGRSAEHFQAIHYFFFFPAFYHYLSRYVEQLETFWSFPCRVDKSHSVHVVLSELEMLARNAPHVVMYLGHEGILVQNTVRTVREEGLPP
jgi:hypothetical protein